MNNGNVYVSDPDYCCMEGFSQRLVIIRRGTCTEETRFITGCTQCVGACSVTWMTISEKWDMNPGTSDCAFFSYVPEDVGQTFCMDLVADMFSGILTLDTPLHVGAASGPCTPFSFFSITCGALLALDDNCVSTVLTRLHIETEGHFQMGYLVGVGTCGVCCAAAVSGASMITIDSTTECPCPTVQNWINVENGGIFKIYGSSISVVKDPDQFTIATGCCSCIDLNCAKFAKYANSSTFLNSTTVRNMNMEGVIGGPCQTIEIEPSSNILSMNMISMAGFITTGCATETLALKCVTWINSTPKITIAANRTWDVTNPVWTIDEAGEVDLAFCSCTTGSVNELYSVIPTVQQIDGTKQNGAKAYIISTLSSTAAIREGCVGCDISTNACGIACFTFTRKIYAATCGCAALTVCTFSTHLLKVYDYGFDGAIVTLGATCSFEAPVILLTDADISDACQASALCACITVCIATEGPCNFAHSIVTVGAGANPGCFAIGDILTGCMSGAVGTVVEFFCGCETCGGRIFLDTRVGAATFTAGETLNDTVGCYSAVYTACTQQNFRVQVLGNNSTMQRVYDALASGRADTTVDANACTEILWGRGERTRFIDKVGCDFNTFRNVANTEGVYVSGLSGTGDLGLFTDDLGGTVSPPATATLTLNNIEEFSDVWIFTNPSTCNTTPLASQPCCVNCPCACNPCKFKFVFSYSIPFCGCFQIKVINLCFQEVNQIDCAGCADKSTRIQQVTDRNFDDPC